MTKICGNCKKEKDLKTGFHKKGERYQSRCKHCQSVYFKEWRSDKLESERTKHRKRQNDLKQLNRMNILHYLKYNPCIKCGETDPVVLDFDHRDATTKTADIAVLLHSVKWENILKEIEKCDILCANCHRRKTAQQFKWFKAKSE